MLSHRLSDTARSAAALRGRRLTLAGAAAIALLLPCALSAATTYYVATNGNDANPGTSTAPVRTLARGVKLAGPGDTVLVRDGPYYAEGAITCGDGCNTNASPVVITKAGTSSAYINIQAEHQWGAVLDCQLQCDSYINLSTGSAYISIQNFVITRGYSEAIHSNDNAHHIVLRGNKFEYIGNRSTTTPYGIVGMYTNPNCHDFVIERNVFHDIGRTNAVYTRDHGLYLHGTNFTVTNNIFYTIQHGWAIQTTGGLSNTLIANNTFAFPNPSQGGQIMVWDQANGLNIRNNIFFQPGANAIVNYNGSTTSCSIDNNVVYGGGLAGSTLGCSTSNNRTADPKLVNTSTAPYDFHVQSGSPAIDTGVAIQGETADFCGTPRPQGAGYDLGAYEYSGSTTAPPVISAVTASGITTSSAIITWLTDKPAESYVQYGTTPYTNATPLGTNLVTNHSMTLSGLTAGTLYHYRVQSKDASGNVATSADYTFTTAPGTIAPPAASFSLSAGAASMAVAKGQSKTNTITATLVSGGAQTVAFSTSAPPSGVTASFSPSGCTVTCSTTLTVSATTAAATGSFTLTVKGTGPLSSSSVNISVSVSNPPGTSGLVANWKFDEGSGAYAGDSSGSGNTGTLQGAAAWALGPYGSALSFNGSTSYISVKESASIEQSSQLTISFWIMASDNPGIDQTVLSKLYSWGVKLNGSAHYPQLSAAGKYAMMSCSMPMGSWQHVVFTFSSGSVQGYINGAPAAFAANTFTGGTSLPAQSYGLYIGTDPGRTLNTKGLVDDVRIYNRVLSASEISGLFSSTRH